MYTQVDNFELLVSKLKSSFDNGEYTSTLKILEMYHPMVRDALRSYSINEIVGDKLGDLLLLHVDIFNDIQNEIEKFYLPRLIVNEDFLSVEKVIEIKGIIEKLKKGISQNKLFVGKHKMRIRDNSNGGCK